MAQSDVEKELMQVDREFNQATQEHRLEGWMQYWDDYGVIDRAHPITGKDAVRAELTPQWEDPNFHLSWTPTAAHALPGGKKGFTWGTWLLTSVDKDGKPVKMTGEYLTVWRKNAEGKWKIIWDGGSANPQNAPKK